MYNFVNKFNFINLIWIPAINLLLIRYICWKSEIEIYEFKIFEFEIYEIGIYEFKIFEFEIYEIRILEFEIFKYEIYEIRILEFEMIETFGDSASLFILYLLYLCILLLFCFQLNASLTEIQTRFDEVDFCDILLLSIFTNLISTGWIWKPQKLKKWPGNIRIFINCLKVLEF